MLTLHEPTEPGRAVQQQQIGQEQVYSVFHPSSARPGIPGQVVQEPVGQRTGPGRRPEVVHSELSRRPESGGPHARTHGRAAAHGHDVVGRQWWRRRGRWWRRRGGRSGSLVPGTASRAVAHSQRTAGDNGQAAQGRGRRGNEERLEVRGHGDRPDVPIHIHVFHGGCHHSGPHVRAPRDRHVIAPPTPAPGSSAGTSSEG